MDFLRGLEEGIKMNNSIIIRRLTVVAVILLLMGLTNQATAKKSRHEVFLPNTDHELNVYRIFGEQPGRTIMIIGGIQGDEPGGYLTADLYAGITLKKGNLIVVPRANFYSILLNQREGLTGDMNRKFGPYEKGERRNSLEQEIVTILKHLIAESDCLINLHEGSGYYSPNWISDIENPKRFGQSIIYDTDVYETTDTEKAIHLGDVAVRVVEKANSQIEKKRYKFRPNNHDTFSSDSLHKEQRRSATFYALTQAHIPAYGIETSKSIRSIETKVRLQKMVVNAFMEELGIVLDSPGVIVHEPELNYLLIKVNTGPAFAMPSGSELKIDAGDEIVVTDIVANYERGLVADIIGLGTKNDTNTPFRISASTRVVVRKDAKQCGWVDIKTSGSRVSLKKKKTKKGQKQEEKEFIPEDLLRVEKLIINVDNKIVSIDDGETLTVKRGARLILRDVRTNIATLDNDVIVNFKGFAPPKAKNDGNDLNYPIYTGQDLWRRYSINKKGKVYPVIALYKDRKVGNFWVELD